jgi:AsmA family protein
LFQSLFFRKIIAVVAALLVLLILAIYFFPWDLLRAPVNRYVSGQLGRHFEITRHLAVHLGRTTTVRVEAVEIANPEWASEPYLLRANAAEFDIELLPLLMGKVSLPRIVLTQPQIGLQVEPDGRRTWALARDTSDKGATPAIGNLQVDQGTLKYLASALGANVVLEFSVAKQAKEVEGTEEALLPLNYKAKGKWKNEPFTASGRTGGVLQLSQNIGAPFPIEVNAVAGKTSLKAKGVIANLAELAGVDATFDLQGRNLEELYKLMGVVLPSTPAYKLRGKLNKHGQVWAASQIQGVLGKSDFSGTLSFDQSAAVPLLTGKVQSKLLDFEDLGPVVGLTPAAARTGPASATPASSASNGAVVAVQKNAARGDAASRKVLPVTPLDVAKLQAMNADVSFLAADIRHARNLPLDNGSVHVKLNAGVLQLDPVSVGVAGGTVAGRIRIDANVTPAAFDTKLDVQGLRLSQLLPAVETTKSSLGRISGKLDLKGRGNSVAHMLGSASGDVAVLMGKGEISNILLEFIGLDGGEAIKFFLRGDRNVELRCAAAAFGVKQGLMTSRAIVLDTSDTVINGRGQVSLAHETLDLVFDPAPKDHSVLSFRSPLLIGGTFSAPSAGPDKGALAGRVGIALALAAINPLLGLAATLEIGPGHDADCAGVLAQAAKPGAVAPLKAGVPATAAIKK